MSTNKRRKYIIDKSFQYNFIARNLALILLVAIFVFVLVVGWNTYRFNRNYLMYTPTSEQLLKWADQHNVPADSVVFACQFIVQSKKYTFTNIVTKPLLATVLINALISIITTIYFSHRMAGPLYRIKKTLREKIAGKETAPINLRKGDLFLELAELVNESLNLNKTKSSS